MLGCTILFGEEEGARVRALIEGATGGPCPCTRGETCPMLARQLPVAAAPVLPLTA
jgi:hypothetical protein